MDKEKRTRVEIILGIGLLLILYLIQWIYQS